MIPLVTKALCWLLCPCAALAWTTETRIDTESEVFGKPAAVYDSLGRIHCVYAADPGGGRQVLLYRLMTGPQWSNAVNLPGPDHKEAGPDIAIDSQGHLHVAALFRPDGDVLPYTVYYWQFDGAAWSGPVQLSPGTGDESYNCSSVHIAVDRNDDVHVCWSRGHATGSAGDIFYRKRQAGAWQATQNITSNPPGYSYGSASPAIAVDRNGNTVHVVWHDDFAVQTRVYYTRNTNLGDPAAWWTAGQWVQLSSDDYGKGPSLFLDPLNRPHVFWTDSNAKYLGYRYWNGSEWAGTINLGAAYNPAAAFDIGRLHLLYFEGDAFYRTYDYTTLSSPVKLNPNIQTYKADQGTILLGYQTNNPLVIWEERQGEWPGIGHLFWTRNVQYVGPTGLISGYVRNTMGTGVPSATLLSQSGDWVASAANGQYAISLPPGTYKLTASKMYYSTQTVDTVLIQAGQVTEVDFTIATTAPNPVGSFTSVPGSERVILNWTNPASGNFSGTMIRVSTSGYPASPSDGTLVTNKLGLPGVQDSFTQTGLSNGVRYYYAAFAHYDEAAFAQGRNATAVPAVKPDFDRDGDVDQADFGHFQTCLSGDLTPQNDPACQDSLIDQDEDVDQDDADILKGCLMGPGIYAAPGCAGESSSAGL